jgi:hypothetical protein
MEAFRGGTGRRSSAGAGHNSSVRLKGRPRSPLKSFRRRRSLELLVRRMISGATLFPVWRRARRPFSQSSQLMGRPLGIAGIWFSEFIRHGSNQCLERGQNTVYGAGGKPLDFRPIQFEMTAE